MKLLSRLGSGLFGRAAWNLIDQVVVSLTNSVLTFLVARSVDDVTFGGFAVAFTVFAVLIGISRAVAASPLAVRFSDADDEAFRSASTSALGAALVVGIVGGLVLLGVGALLGDVGGEGILALGLVLPGLLVQDTWRQVFFAAGRPAAAAVNSLVWTVVQFAAVALLLASGLGTVLMLVLAWGGAALVAAVLGTVQSRSVPRPTAALAWLREHRDLAGYNVADFGVQQGAMQGSLLLLGTIASVAAIGTVRGTLVLLGMTSVLAMATVSFALPEIARRRGSFTARQWYVVALALSALVVVVGLVWGLIFLLAPDDLGRALLGESWDGVRAVLLPAIIGQALLAAGIGPSTVVRAMDRAQVTFRRNLIMCPLILAGGVAGALLGQAEGAFWGFAAAYSVGVPLWFYLMYREIHAHLARAAEPESESESESEHARRPVAVEPVDPYFTDLATMALPTMRFTVVQPRPRSRPEPRARPAARPASVLPTRAPVPRVAVPGPADALGSRARPAPPPGTVPVRPAGPMPPDAPPRSGAPVRGTRAGPFLPAAQIGPGPVAGPGRGAVPYPAVPRPAPGGGPGGPGARPPVVPGPPAPAGPAGRPGRPQPGPPPTAAAAADGPVPGAPRSGWFADGSPGPGRPTPGQQGLAQPGPAQPRPAQPGPGQHGRGHGPGQPGPGPGPGHHGPVQHGRGQPVPGHGGPAHRGPLHPGPTRSAPPVSGPVRSGPEPPAGRPVASRPPPQPRPADAGVGPAAPPAVDETVRTPSSVPERAGPDRDAPPTDG